MGHGELTRAVQGRGEGEDEGGGGVAQGGGAGAQVPPPARVGREVERRALNSGAGGEGGLQVRDRGREVREVEGRKEGGAPDRVGTHGGRCEGRAGCGSDRGRGRRELMGPPGEAMDVQPHPRCS